MDIFSDLNIPVLPLDKILDIKNFQLDPQSWYAKDPYTSPKNNGMLVMDEIKGFLAPVLTDGIFKFQISQLFCLVVFSF